MGSCYSHLSKGGLKDDDIIQHNSYWILLLHVEVWFQVGMIAPRGDGLVTGKQVKALMLGLTWG